MHDFSTRIAEVSAPAKINLCLIVGPRQADGFHPVCSVMEKIKLFDTLRTVPEAEGAGIRLTGSEIAPPENLVMKAALALEQETGRRLDVDIELKKEIPVAAGLGGGSSDAAAILKLLIFAFDLEISPEKLREMALSLGADVPFFLTAGPQLARGVGEVLDPITTLPEYSLVLIKPDIDLPTTAVYSKYDQIKAGSTVTGTVSEGSTGPARSKFDERCRRLRADIAGLSGPASLTSILQNDLEPAALTMFSGLDSLKREIIDAGAIGALMSGSGSSVFGIFPDIETAGKAAAKLAREHRRIWTAEPYRE